jgi:multidrug efflux system outer membrane protein
MKREPMKYIFFFVMIAASSCAVTKPYQPPAVNTLGLYRDSTGTDTANIANLHWTEVFRDTLLQNLIGEGIRNNLDLKIAYSRRLQAQAYFEQSRQAFLPNLNADVNVVNGKQTNTSINTASNTTTHLYQLNANASWEADLWGKLKSSKRASLAALLQSEAFSKTVQTGLVADIANYYYTLIGLDQELLITQESVKNWKATVETMKVLKDADIVTGAAVVQSDASRYAVEVTIPDIKQNIRQTENALCILIGRVPGPVLRSTLYEQQAGTLLYVGVPAQLLANRPDVQESELNFRYAFELVNVARTYFYPSLVISASAGLNGSSVSNLFNPFALLGNIAAGLTQPVLNQGINRTRLNVARQGQQQALLSFQKVLLTAGQEVSDDLTAYQNTLEKKNLRDSQIVNLQDAVEYTQLLVRNSSANYTEVLTAQQSLLAAQLNQVNDRLQQLQSIVHLYTDLGGGWK